MTATTYRAVQVSKPGRLEVVERELTAPLPGKVRIRIEACGVCRTDRHTVEGLHPGVRYPCVPGHEVVGRIDALGEGVSAWKLGQRVGVSFLGGHCGRCMPCRRGDFVNCQNQAMCGLTEDGGYAEVMIADERALAAVPAELAPADATGAGGRGAPAVRRRHDL
jgi:D-arabinose 1-dehydrogenase-like Zn-dependent alcohol dehydrogenase